MIALKTQQLIKEGMTLFVDGGTTACAVAEYLPLDIKVRVVTNNHPLICILTAYKNIELISTGGNYDPYLQIFTGTVTCTAVAQFTADMYVMGVCGVDSQFGISAAFQQDAAVKRTMKKNTIKTVVLANHERLGDTNTFKICEAHEIDVLVTDLKGGDGMLDAFRALDIRIL
ncbi:MAG: hypothetical protein QM664_04865 [Flavihumibacter sp.]